MGTYFSTFSPAHSQWTKELNWFFFLLICIIIQEMCVLNEANYYFPRELQKCYLFHSKERRLHDFMLEFHCTELTKVF